MTNDRDSVRIATEALLLLIYAWNSAPVLGTDLPCSLIVTGQVFSFPLDFSVQKHLDLTSTPATVDLTPRIKPPSSLPLRTFIAPSSNTTVHGIVNGSIKVAPTLTLTTLVILCSQGVLLSLTPNVAVLEN